MKIEIGMDITIDIDLTLENRKIGNIDRQIHSLMDGCMHVWTDRQTNRQADRQTGRQADRQTERWRDRSMHQIDRLIDIHICIHR